MNAGKREQDFGRALRQEIKLRINERLYETGMIPKEVCEEARIRIVTERQSGKRGKGSV